MSRSLVPRAHLQRLLDEGHQLTLVLSGPGSGRTTLLQQWSAASARRSEAVWAATPAEHVTPQTWWSHVLGLLVDAGLLEPSVAGSTDNELVLVRALNRLTAGATLVIDDLDLLPDAVVRSLVHVLGRTGALSVVASAHARADLPESLPGDTLIVDDLTLSVPEVATATGLDLDAATRLHAAVQGHPNGLRTIAVDPVGSLSARSDRIELWREHDLVVSVRADEVRRRVRSLDALDIGTDHGALLRSWALADPVTPDLLRELTGHPRIDEVVARTVRAGLARVEPDATGGQVLHLTDPVRTVLLSGPLAPRSHPGERGLHGRHARWALRHGDLPRALRASAHADDPGLASEVLAAGGLPFLWQAGAELVELFGTLPLRRIQHHPVLAMALGLALNSRRQHRLRAAELFVTAAAGARLSKHVSPADRALMSVVESVALRLTGMGDAGAGAARRAARALDRLDQAGRESLGSLYGDLHLHTGIGLLHSGAAEEAVAQFEAGAAAAPPLSPHLHAYALLAGTAALRGDLVQARSWSDLALSFPWPPDKIDDYQGSMLRLAQSVLALEAGDADAAASWLDRVWPIIPTIEHWGFLVRVRALIDITRDEPLEGLERLAEVRRTRRARTGSSDPARRRLSEVQALLHLAAEQPALAERALREAGREDVRVTVARARVALAQDRPDLALAKLGRAAALGFPAPRLRAEHAALETATLLSLGRPEHAERAARRLGALLSSTGLRTPVLLLPGPSRDQVRRLLAGETDPDTDTRQPHGEIRTGSHAAAAPPTSGRTPRLTPREQVVLHQLVRSRSNADIAQALVVSPNTVKSQLRSLYRKLGASSREQALAAAVGFGLLLPPHDPEAREDDLDLRPPT